MIKSELILKIAEQNPHLYQRDIENIVNAILDTITNALARGDRVELRGFGAFAVKKREARTGRNPRTGDAVAVSEKVDPDLQDREGDARAIERDGVRRERSIQVKRQARHATVFQGVDPPSRRDRRCASRRGEPRAGDVFV